MVRVVRFSCTTIIKLSQIKVITRITLGKTTKKCVFLWNSSKHGKAGHLTGHPWNSRRVHCRTDFRAPKIISFYFSDIWYGQDTPCKARIDAPDALHHIIVRGIERKSIFTDGDFWPFRFKILSNKMTWNWRKKCAVHLFLIYIVPIAYIAFN